jgi:predicted kinase
MVETQPTLLVLQGLPASGKSTYAKELLAARPVGSAVRINNDDLATMLFGDAYARSEYSAQLLGKVRADMVRQAFRSHVQLVIVDNTNLNPKTVDGLKRLAASCNARFELDSSFLEVPLEVCIARNATRPSPVPEKVILEMARLIP